jgi:glycosyltransferase involved in cell wall biosynthesis
MLVDAVESCLTQTWRDVEVIVIDDGSTDDTEQLVTESLARSWPEDRVRYVRQQNQGASVARNHGLRLARGDYVQFLDSDDLLQSTKIAKQVAALEEPHNSEAACCYCYGWKGAVFEDATLGALTRIGVRAANPGELVRALCSRLTHGMPTPAPLWRRSFLMEHAGWREDIALGDDLEYHIRLLVDAKKICFIEEELFFVREHTGPRLGATHMSASSLASLIRTRQAIFNSVQQCGLWDSPTQRAFLSAMRTIYANALQVGDKETIRNLENWLWSLSSSPRRMTGFQLLIVARRLLGRRFLLGTHKFLANPTTN